MIVFYIVVSVLCCSLLAQQPLFKISRRITRSGLCVGEFSEDRVYCDSVRRTVMNTVVDVGCTARKDGNGIKGVVKQERGQKVDALYRRISENLSIRSDRSMDFGDIPSFVQRWGLRFKLSCTSC